MLTRKVVQRLLSAIEGSFREQQICSSEDYDLAHVSFVADAESERLGQVIQRGVILIELRFGEAEHGEGVGVFGREGDYFAERGDGVGVLLAIIGDGSEIPPTLGPSGAQLDRLTI